MVRLMFGLAISASFMCSIAPVYAQTVARKPTAAFDFVGANPTPLCIFDKSSPPVCVPIGTIDSTTHNFAATSETLAVTGAGAFGSIAVSGNASTGALTASSVTVSGDITASGALSVGTTSSFTGPSDFNGAVTLDGAVTSSVGLTSTYTGNYWTDGAAAGLTSGPVNNPRIKGRTFFGLAAEADSATIDSFYSMVNGVPASSSYPKPLWISRGAQALSWAMEGQIGIAGISRNSDYTGSIGSIGTVGVAGIAIDDRGTDSNIANVWAMYAEAYIAPNGAHAAYGIEIDCGNDGIYDRTASPYEPNKVGCYGANIAAGGSVHYPTPPYAMPSVTAIVIQGNTQTFNSGIIIANTALTDHGGFSRAIELPSNSLISWHGGHESGGAWIDDGDFFTINSSVSNINNRMSLVASNSILTVFSAGLKAVSMEGVASAVNYLRMNNNATGSAPTIRCDGTDANIGCRIQTKGTGLLELSYAATTATSAPAFSANRYVPMKFGGTTYYVPASTVTW
jgi:hypothetical protein